MSPEEELDKINEVLDLFKVPKDEGYAIYTTLGRVSWLARKSAQQSMHADAACACPDDGNLQINSDFVCAVCHKTPRR
mgnify:CR=1 FL=1